MTRTEEKTDHDGKDKLVIIERINPSFTTAIESNAGISGKLNTPGYDMCDCQEVDEPSRPTMKPGQFV